jgi:hypothetical protein
LPRWTKLIATLSKAAERMHTASDRLRAASAADLGGGDLDHAAADFQSRWEYGIGKISQASEQMTDSLRGGRSQMASNHDGAGTVIAGLRQVYAADPGTATEVLQLPAGRALATVREEPLLIQLHGVAPVALLQRQVVAWIPDRAGSAVAVVGVASNCWQDWPHVCDLALEVVDSVAWDDR